jgi:hypothetical protein
VKNLKAMWQDPVWSKVISTGIIATLGFLISYLAGWLPTFSIFIKNVWGWFFQISSIYNWVLVLVFIPCLLFFYVVMFWLKSLVSSNDSFQSYICDTFFDLKWRWSYYFEGKISIDDVHCFCPRCDHQVFPQDVSGYRVAPEFKYDCPDCHYSVGTREDNFVQIRQKVILKVQKNIRNGEWRGNA